MSSKVGGIARAPVWGANLSYKSSPKSQPLHRTVVPSAGLRLVGLEVVSAQICSRLFDIMPHNFAALLSILCLAFPGEDDILL